MCCNKSHSSAFTSKTTAASWLALYILEQFAYGHYSALTSREEKLLQLLLTQKNPQKPEWNWAQISYFLSFTSTFSQESPEDRVTHSQLQKATKAATAQIKWDVLHHELSVSVVQRSGQKGFMLFWRPPPFRGETEKTRCMKQYFYRPSMCNYRPHTLSCLVPCL